MALLVAALLVAPSAVQAALSPSVYRVGRLCGASEPGYSSCLGLRLVPRQPASQPDTRISHSVSRAVGPARKKIGKIEKIEFTEPRSGSLSPGEVLGVYGLSGLLAPANQQTLALVDAYDDPTIEHDLEVFDTKYGLEACTTADGCFRKVEMESEGKLPPTEGGWAQEISTDVEVAHSVCQECKIVLVEAYSNENEDLEAAELKAEELGATEISNSWGGSEVGTTVEEDEHDAFNDPGTVITAAVGDEGYLNWNAEKESERGYPDYPASSPHVVAVGGTRLTSSDGKWESETVWNGDGASGGGCSAVLEVPVWQHSLPDWPAVGCGSHRAVADVSADADPYTGVSVYDSTPVIEEGIEYSGWMTIGGTSVASPIIAGTYALAGGAGTEPDGETVNYPAQTLYENLAFDPAALHDVTEGSNGKCIAGYRVFSGLAKCSIAEEGQSCSQTAICVARSGYDGPSGVGTPNGIAAFQPLSAANRKTAEEELTKQHAAEEKREREAREAQEQKENELKERAAKEKEAAQKSQQKEAGEQPLGAKAVEEIAVQAEHLAAELSSGGTTTSQGNTTAGGQQPTNTQTASSPVLSDLALTNNARAALSHGRFTATELAFTFTSSAAAHVKVTIARKTIVHERAHWTMLRSYTLTITAAKGHDRFRLNAHRTLRQGSYRLTLTPAHGAPRTLTFQAD